MHFLKLGYPDSFTGSYRTIFFKTFTGSRREPFLNETQTSTGIIIFSYILFLWDDCLISHHTIGTTIFHELFNVYPTVFTYHLTHFHGGVVQLAITRAERLLITHFLTLFQHHIYIHRDKNGVRAILIQGLLSKILFFFYAECLYFHSFHFFSSRYWNAKPSRYFALC